MLFQTLDYAVFFFVTASLILIIKNDFSLMYKNCIQKIERKVSEIVNNSLSTSAYNYTDLRNQIILELHPFISELTGRHPIILPVIMEVKVAK